MNMEYSFRATQQATCIYLKEKQHTSSFVRRFFIHTSSFYSRPEEKNMPTKIERPRKDFWPCLRTVPPHPASAPHRVTSVPSSHRSVSSGCCGFGPRSSPIGFQTRQQQQLGEFPYPLAPRQECRGSSSSFRRPNRHGRSCHRRLCNDWRP